MHVPPLPVLGLLAALTLGPAHAAADTIVLTDGKEIDGFVTGVNDRKVATVRMEKGKRTFLESTIAGIRPSTDAAADFERYFAGIGKKDAEAFFEVARWARERELPEAAEKAFRKTLELKTDHEGARAALGYRRIDGEWLTEEQIRQRARDAEAKAEYEKRFRDMLGAAPEVNLRAHWAYVDFLSDRKGTERADQMEAAYAKAVEVLGSEPWAGRGLVVACSGEESYLKWVDAFVAKLPGASPSLLEWIRKSTGMKWNDPPVLGRWDEPDPYAMHSANVHAAGHLLVNRWGGHNRANPFWIEEGFGGWMEETILRTNLSYCYGLVKGGYGATFRGVEKWEVAFPAWKDLAREAVRTNSFLPLDQLDALQSGEYSRREVGQAFSFVAFLIRERGPEKWREFLKKVKGGTRSPLALEAVYGQGFTEMESEWKRFVANDW